MVKNCDLGHSFLTIRTSQPANKICVCAELAFERAQKELITSEMITK